MTKKCLLSEMETLPRLAWSARITKDAGGKRQPGVRRSRTTQGFSAKVRRMATTGLGIYQGIPFTGSDAVVRQDSVVFCADAYRSALYLLRQAGEVACSNSLDFFIAAILWVRVIRFKPSRFPR